jgi:hypothetical protein
MARNGEEILGSAWSGFENSLDRKKGITEFDSFLLFLV